MGKLPDNVTGLTVVHLQDLPIGNLHLKEYGDHLVNELEGPLTALNEKADMKDFVSIIETLAPYKKQLGSEILLDGRDTWEMITRMYEASFSESSFLDYFWSWRAMMGGLYSLLLAPLPEARVYHALSTGYAGIMLARAKVETNKPCMVTEHGLYTNERRIELASADWLEETASKALTIDKTRQNLRDLWMNTFASYSRICYEAADRILTLYAGNQVVQQQDGAVNSKMNVIPNGVPLANLASITRKDKSYPCIALIGRVVPIKDIKSFIRVCGLLHEYFPDLKAYIIGPTEEDHEYFVECSQLVAHMGLDDTVTFTGKVKIDEYLSEIDVLVLTSISEAQPLVLLEAGACGIPLVTTDVGACREIIHGREDEDPWLGDGGMVTSLSNPVAIAEAVYTLLSTPEKYQACGAAIKQRVNQYYNLEDQIQSYRDLYNAYLEKR